MRPKGREPMAWLGVPLLVEDRVIGVMAVQSYDDGAAYGEEEKELMTFVSTQVGMAIQRKQAELKRIRLATVVEQASEVVLLSDTEGVILYVNPAFERCTGLARKDAIGMGLSSLDGITYGAARFDEMWNTVQSGETWSGRLAVRNTGGDRLEMEARCSPIRDRDGSILGFVMSQRDVTEELALEAQMRQAQKMEAVGRLAGGVAHDFNNQLTAIGGYADLLFSDFDVDDPQRDRAGAIIRATNRAAALTRQLLAFSKKQVLKPMSLDLNECVAGVEGMLGRLIGEHIELVPDLDPDLGRVWADAGQVEQVIVNLVLNARDAMPSGGRLVIRTSNATLDEEAAGHLGAEPGSYVKLAVMDTGCGIDAERLSQVFEPFFTTKGEHGTGLGLSMIYGIVKQSGGAVVLHSQPGVGTTADVYLPRSATAEEPSEPPEEKAPPRAGSGTILLVEDEKGVRELAAEVLKSAGYHVLSAECGEEALEISARFTGEIHLLLSDVVMPGIGGPDLAIRLLEERPGMKALLMSGYAKGTLDRRAHPAFPLLEKPFNLDELSRTVHEMIAADAPVSGDPAPSPEASPRGP